MSLETVTVVSHRRMSESCYRLSLACGPGYGRAAPGQFVMLRPGGGVSPLLRRPFSIHNLHERDHGGHVVEILYKVVGAGTALLALSREGDRFDLLGPLGRGFSVREEFGRIAIVAGGIGVAPMIFLAHRLKKRQAGLGGVRVFLGGRTEADLLCREDFDALGLPVHTTTDDGSSGDQCLVTLPLELAVAEREPEMVYACGPTEMLRCIQGIAEARDLKCEISIETAMACGMGACLGCAVEKSSDKGTFLHACLNGPVFPAGDVVL
jgi:dihydroorotate dehydrogenase electron transfer subunit